MIPATARATVRLMMASTLLASYGRASTLALSYLQLASDRFQSTVHVYTVADDAGNHFPARGEFDNLNGGLVPAMDEISPNVQCPGITCITATFDPRRTLWGGWYFMNGILGATDRQPAPNWGFTPDAGYTTLPGAFTGLEGATTHKR